MPKPKDAKQQACAPSSLILACYFAPVRQALYALRSPVKPEHLVDEILARTVNENVTFYKSMLENVPRNEVTDPYWKELLAFYDKSNQGERELIITLMKQVSQDSIASLLSIIDGSGYSELKTELKLTDDSGKPLQGELSDIFIEKCEESGI